MEAMGKTKLEITEIKEGSSSCTVVHGQSSDGKVHFVGIGSLKVVIVKDGPTTWFAQGLDIDYAAEGTNVENVKLNFQNGLISTIDQHLKANNSLSKLLKPAPNDVWQEMYYGPLLGKGKVLKNYHQISIHLPDQIKKFTAFENIGIEYFELEQAA
jgi:hypothetical protein